MTFLRQWPESLTPRDSVECCVSFAKLVLVKINIGVYDVHTELQYMYMIAIHSKISAPII